MSAARADGAGGADQGARADRLRPWRQWSLRARFTALTTLAIVLTGAVLLTVQYVAVRHMMDQAVTTVTGGVDAIYQSDDGGATFYSTTDDPTDLPPGGGAAPTSPPAAIEQDLTMTVGAAISDEVLNKLMTWSLIALAVFAVLAYFVASWLSKRSLRRVAEITAATRQISQDRLGERLDLPGPDDEIKELGDTIDHMLERIDAAFTAQKRFVSNASHELRTPLTTARLALEIPLAQGKVPPELEGPVHTALAAGERSEALIAALLTLARADASEGQVSALAEGADLATITGGVVAARAEQAAARDQQILADLPATAPVRGDATLLELAVSNLVDNAVRHGAPGAIDIVLVREGGTLALTVANGGPELTAADAERLAEPFNRGDKTRLRGADGGLGLGLSVVADVAKAHGGRLALAPRDGGGLTATLSLPAA
jgi:signal transduction histidine kinase